MRIADVNSLDMATGEWLILSQAAYQLLPITNDLKSNGYLFSYRGRRSISEKVSEAVNGWEQLRRGRQVSGAVARIVYRYLSTGARLVRGYTTLSALGDDDHLQLHEHTTPHGPRPTHNTH